MRLMALMVPKRMPEPLFPLAPVLCSEMPVTVSSLLLAMPQIQ
jgi:hypothetical protein